MSKVYAGGQDARTLVITGHLGHSFEEIPPVSYRDGLLDESHSISDVLSSHVKTYCRQAKGRTSTKLTTMVEFPLNDFDMTPHLVRRSSSSAESPGHSRSPRRRHSKPPPANPQENVYDLYAICYHHGDDLETGHYTAACKNPYDDRWYKFDDSRVTPVDEANAYAQLVNNTVYMLFYKRKRPTVVHSCSTNDKGHWALLMPKYVKPVSEALNDLGEVKEEPESIKIPQDDSDIEEVKGSPAISVPSLPDVSKDAPTNDHLAPVIHSTAIIQSPTLQRPLVIEVNGESNDRTNDDLSDYENEIVHPEPYIHKDVHVNPKMTPVDSRRPRSVDYPTRSGTSPPNRDASRNYESSPLVASINGVEYHPTTEDLMLSMFQESKYIVPRHGNHMSGESHRTGQIIYVKLSG